MEFSLEDLYPYLTIAGRIVLLFSAAWAASKVLDLLIRRLRGRIFEVMSSHAGENVQAMEKRAATVGGVLRKTVAAVIWVAAVTMALKEAGFDVAPLLAGAGIAGLAIGFGAQSLVRDVLSGMFMLVENQIRVGDVAQINGTGGLVEEINLRTTVLRSQDGSVHVFPNGSIQTLSNMTREFSFYVFEIGVAYKEDTDRVAQVLGEVGESLRAEPDWQRKILEPLEILGVDKFAESAVVLKARIKTKPIEQWGVGREMNRRIKKRFDEEGIEIPFPQVAVSFGGGVGREELKRMVREILDE